MYGDLVMDSVPEKVTGLWGIQGCVSFTTNITGDNCSKFKKVHEYKTLDLNEAQRLAVRDGAVWVADWGGGPLFLRRGTGGCVPITERDHTPGRPW